MKKKLKKLVIKFQRIILGLHKSFFKSHYRKILDLIEPNIIGVRKQSFGKEGDGTYILPIDLIEDSSKFKLLSFGVSNDISFEKDFIRKFKNIDVFAFDPTINELPEKHDNIKFLKLGLAGKNIFDQGLLTLNEIIRRLNLDYSYKYILKIDIERWEWPFLAEVDFDLIDIPVIAIELHFLPAPFDTVSIPYKFYKKYKILKKLFRHYHIHHIHANNLHYQKFDTFHFPVLLELTLIKKSIFQKEMINDIKRLNSPNKLHKADFQYPFESNGVNNFNLNTLLPTR